MGFDIMKKACLAGAAALALVSAPASGATLITDANGRLTGATGVDIRGISYDVEFVDGTFDVVFSNGADLYLLPFHSAALTDYEILNGYTGADFAAEALLDQVFIDRFDHATGDISGCSDFGLCAAFVPIGFDGLEFFGSVAVNHAGYGYHLDFVTRGGGGRQDDLSGRAELTFARFSVSNASSPQTAAVPEPASWFMLLIGFFGIA